MCTFSPLSCDTRSQTFHSTSKQKLHQLPRYYKHVILDTQIDERILKLTLYFLKNKYDYSPSEIVDMIIEYERANENYRQCPYALRYPDHQCSNHTTIMRLKKIRAREIKLCHKRKKKSLIDANDLNTAVLGMVVINPQIDQRTIAENLMFLSQLSGEF